jgi:hypothetical protein
MGDKKKKTEAGNLGLNFEKPKEKGGARSVVVSFQDGDHVRKKRIGLLTQSTIDTDLGSIECWAFEADGSSGFGDVKKKTAGDVKRAVNDALWQKLFGAYGVQADIAGDDGQVDQSRAAGASS